MEQELTQLRQEVKELKAEINKLQTSSLIPIAVERAFKDRLKGIYAAESSTGAYTQANIRRTITVSATPQDISVLEDPAGYIKVQFGTGTYKLAYFND
jgi:hypothetical protein